MQKIKSFDAFFSKESKGEVTESIISKAKAAVKNAPKKNLSTGDKAKLALMAKKAAVNAGVKTSGTAVNQIKKAGKLTESVISVSGDYKVKVVLDIPKKVIEAYCKRVKSETGQEATSIFSKDELAEEIIKFLVKNNLNAETIPTAIAVGDSAGSSATTSNGSVQNNDVATPMSNDDPFADETEEFEFDDSDDDEEEDSSTMKKGSSAMDFQGTEIEEGEGDKESLELDPKQPKNY